ncbi:MAG: hypothetical protein HXS46_12485 [Theionarchaea archaeon]|nr:MAG: hypothetical protein AYK18_03260 [Theionarchaea archaeon DG-70]MBU7011499.1 hypothetical protein [Theionarchaea archaeon]
MLESLEEKLRKERESSELSPLTEDFFLQLQEHMNMLQLSQDPLSQKKLQLLQEGIKELLDLRARKILEGRHTGMLKAEAKLAEFRSTFQKFKKDVLTSLLQREATTKRVIVLQDIPQFYGPELEILGPYKKGEIVLLDKTIVTLLKEKGLIEEKER